ncbi:MAG: MFS transporter [Lachnospiraceae bacterium]|nr:MFS transporter [Lachnospiraceae bacterium]
MFKREKNKYLNGVLPMFLITFSIGAVYCWTLFKDHVNEYTGFSRSVTEWCFSLAIFCLGMSSAIGGKIVEKNPRKSAFLTFIFFTTGWLMTGIGIQIKNPIITILGFGVVQGIGLGLGYITPIKTLMIWFADRRGFAAGLTIAGFGIAGVIANPIIGFLLESGLKVYTVFYVLTGIYAVALFIASRLLYRPEFSVPEGTVTMKAGEFIKERRFILLWLVVFLNITCGLALISQEKQLYNAIGVANMGLVVLLCSINAVSNVVGRISLASWQDKLKTKHTPYYIMAVMSLLVCFIAAINQNWLSTTFLMIFVVQFFFGVGFGCMPNILHQNYGIHQLSTVHGLLLSAWAFAGLAGNQFASFVLNDGLMRQALRLGADPAGCLIDHLTNYTQSILFAILGSLFTIMLIILLIWNKVRLHSADQMIKCES